MADKKEKFSEERQDQKAKKPHYSLTPKDVGLIENLRRRFQTLALKNNTDAPADINKSEIVRAGINVLNKLSDKQFYEAIESLDKLRKGRPEKKK